MRPDSGGGQAGRYIVRWRCKMRGAWHFCIGPPEYAVEAALLLAVNMLRYVRAAGLSSLAAYLVCQLVPVAHCSRGFFILKNFIVQPLDARRRRDPVFQRSELKNEGARVFFSAPCFEIFEGTSLSVPVATHAVVACLCGDGDDACRVGGAVSRLRRCWFLKLGQLPLRGWCFSTWRKHGSLSQNRRTKQAEKNESPAGHL
jgi:hypothetical protein